MKKQSEKPGRLSLVVAVIVAYAFAACHHRSSAYENDLGIQPAVVAQIDTANYTRIKWEDSTETFGVVKEGDSVIIKFRFKNVGETELFISAVRPSCGCIVPDYPRKAILPGEDGVLTATFDTHYRQGFIQKTIVVTTNTSNGTNHLLRFSGEVKNNSGQ